MSMPDQAPPCCATVLEKQISGAPVLVLLIVELLHVRSPICLSVSVSGLTCLKQRNQTKAFLQEKIWEAGAYRNDGTLKRGSPSCYMAWVSCAADPAVVGTTDCSQRTAKATGWRPCCIIRKGNERLPEY